MQANTEAKAAWYKDGKESMTSRVLSKSSLWTRRNMRQANTYHDGVLKREKELKAAGTRGDEKIPAIKTYPRAAPSKVSRSMCLRRYGDQQELSALTEHRSRGVSILLTSSNHL